MTAKEFIKEISKCDADSIVYIHQSTLPGLVEVTSVEESVNTEHGGNVTGETNDHDPLFEVVIS